MRYLGVDVGGSALKYAVMDEDMRMYGQGSHPRRPEDRGQFLAAVEDLFDLAGRPQGGVAMSYCGEVDERSGEVLSGGSYAFNAGTNLKRDLEARLGCPVSLENDGNCAALAELKAGSLRGRRSAVVIVVGTGLGGAIIVDGHVHHGAHKFAGGLSLLTASLDADLGSCHGYTDAPVAGKVAGAEALARGYAMACGKEATKTQDAPKDGREFFALVDAGDKVALAVLEDYARSFATIVYNVQQVLDVEAFAIGGGVSAAPAFGAALKAELDRLYAGSFATRLGLAKPELVLCERRNDANLVGALVHHLGG